MEEQTTLIDAGGGPVDFEGRLAGGSEAFEGIESPVSLVGNSLEHRACANLRALVDNLTAQLKIKDQQLALADLTIEDQRREIARLEEVAERRLGPTWE